MHLRKRQLYCAGHKYLKKKLIFFMKNVFNKIDQVYYLAENLVNNRVSTQVSAQVRDQVQIQVSTQFRSQVWIQVSSLDDRWIDALKNE